MDYRSAYKNTDYIVFEPEALVLTVDQFSPKIEEILIKYNCKTAAFLTAWNPLSQVTDDKNNRAVQQQLAVDLHQLDVRVFEGIGKARDGDWPGEESFLVLGIERIVADQLAVKYNQYAWLWVQIANPVELVMTRHFMNKSTDSKTP